MIGIMLDSSNVSAGEFVTGTLTWKAERTERARLLTVRAEWETNGRGNDVFTTARQAQFPCSADEVENVIPFRMLIPHEGPVSYTGMILSIGWKIIAVVQVDGGPDESTEIELTVRPRRVPLKRR